MPRTPEDFTAKWNDKKIIDQKNKQIVFFGNRDSVSGVPKSSHSGWSVVKSLDGFSVGGTLTQGNTSMVPLIAKSVAGNIVRARVTK